MIEQLNRTINGIFLNEITFNINPIFFIVGMVILLIVVIVLIILVMKMNMRLQRMKRRIDRFIAGNNGKSLENEIIAVMEDNKFIKVEMDKNKKEILALCRNTEKSFQRYGVVKYDALHQMGGQLSFCIALLDGNKNGFIINSVHGTDGCYSYTKEIKGGESEIPLGKEEEEALEIALS